MPYEYGSQRIDIRNPFRLEGAAAAARAAIFILLAIYLMLDVKNTVAAGDRTLGWLQMGGGIVLLGLGIAAAYRGLFKLFRFYVGRGMPADLASTASAQQSIMPGASTGGTTGFRGIYSLNTLAEMLLARKNPTFVEPVGWLARLLHSVARNLIFLPYPMRNDAVALFVAAANSLVLIVLLALAWFSGVTGLTPITNTPVMGWLVALVTAALLFIWLREAMHRGRAAERSATRYRPFRMAIWAGIAVLLPLGLSALNAANPLPRLPLSPYPWFVLTLVGGALALAYGLVLALRRAPKESPLTQVSEFREHWQESVHPMDIFRAVEITLADHRFQEIPNRVYENDVPELLAQGSQNKGEFKGRTLQEIQPQPVADHRDERIVLGGVVAAQVLLLVAGLCIFLGFLELGSMSQGQIVATALGTLIAGIFGTLVARSAHLYLSEIEFESDLVAFDVTGTFSESRLATGMSIYDSTRSENLIVRSSITPWLLVSHLRSSMLAESGAANLEQPRFILGMEQNAALSRSLVDGLRAFLRDRQIMATVQSEGDAQAASTIYQMNERTRARPTNGQQPQISNDMRDDKLLAPGGGGTGTDPGTNPSRQ
jgi:hypothetical protein